MNTFQGNPRHPGGRLDTGPVRPSRKKVRRACGGKVADWCYPVHQETCPTCKAAP